MARTAARAVRRSIVVALATKNYFCFCVFRVKTIFPSKNLRGRGAVTYQGALEICLIRAAFFIHRIASQNVDRGNSLDIFIYNALIY